ncbi:unnamed protein product [Linum trigynum]|uniref:Uncharacterized protein n=1 Tax=Linum trigynum TaxID=586398 RepID=A0AAV2EPK6_9ROSI
MSYAGTPTGGRAAAAAAAARPFSSLRTKGFLLLPMQSHGHHIGFPDLRSPLPFLLRRFFWRRLKTLTPVQISLPPPTPFGDSFFPPMGPFSLLPLLFSSSSSTSASHGGSTATFEFQNPNIFGALRSSRIQPL